MVSEKPTRPAFRGGVVVAVGSDCVVFSSSSSAWTVVSPDAEDAAASSAGVIGALTEAGNAGTGGTLV